MTFFTITKSNDGKKKKPMFNKNVKEISKLSIHEIS